MISDYTRKKKRSEKIFWEYTEQKNIWKKESCEFIPKTLKCKREWKLRLGLLFILHFIFYCGHEISLDSINLQFLAWEKFLLHQWNTLQVLHLINFQLNSLFPHVRLCEYAWVYMETQDARLKWCNVTSKADLKIIWINRKVHVGRKYFLCLEITHLLC